MEYINVNLESFLKLIFCLGLLIGYIVSLIAFSIDKAIAEYFKEKKKLKEEVY